MDFPSWIDQRIADAEERGVFDNLPGTGKPIPGRGEADHGQAWLRDYLRREGVSADALLPAPLRLRKEIERLTSEVQQLPSERQVREIVQALNRQIVDWRRNAVGPPIFVPLVDEEKMVASWKAGQSARPGASAAADAGPATSETPPPRRRWWRPSLRRRGAGRAGSGRRGP
jgi:hypothetical protein